jgi:hypothetical protein
MTTRVQPRGFWKYDASKKIFYIYMNKEQDTEMATDMLHTLRIGDEDIIGPFEYCNTGKFCLKAKLTLGISMEDWIKLEKLAMAYHIYALDGISVEDKKRMGF